MNESHLVILDCNIDVCGSLPLSIANFGIIGVHPFCSKSGICHYFNDSGSMIIIKGVGHIPGNTTADSIDADEPTSAKQHNNRLRNVCDQVIVVVT